MLKLKRKIIFYCDKNVICTLELETHDLPKPKQVNPLKERATLYKGKGNFSHGDNYYYEISKKEYYYDTVEEISWDGRKITTYEQVNVRYNNTSYSKRLYSIKTHLEENLQKVKDISNILYKKYGINISWTHTEFLLNNGFFNPEEFAKHGIQL